ncbi:hypothetical protein CRYUN_Cryun03dG0067400 [Craigia yunnanensis]
MSSTLLQTDESGNLSESKKISGIIGAVSVLSTLIFLEKIVWWSTRNGEEYVPVVVCSDPALDGGLISQGSIHSSLGEIAQKEVNQEPIIQNLRHKRGFLELAA